MVTAHGMRGLHSTLAMEAGVTGHVVAASLGHERVTTTVQILCDAVRAKKLTTAMVEELADHLLENEYYLPFSKGGFRNHVLTEGLLEYDDF